MDNLTDDQLAEAITDTFALVREEIIAECVAKTKSQIEVEILNCLEVDLWHQVENENLRVFVSLNYLGWVFSPVCSDIPLSALVPD